MHSALRRTLSLALAVSLLFLALGIGPTPLHVDAADVTVSFVSGLNSWYTLTTTFRAAGGSGYGERGVRYRKKGGTIWVIRKSATYDNPFTVKVSGLTANTEYEIQGYMKYTGGTAYSATKVMRTGTLPTLTVKSVDEITNTSATTHSYINPNGNNLHEVTLKLYKVSDNSLYKTRILATNLTSASTFNYGYTTLSSGTYYQLQLEATNKYDEVAKSGLFTFKTTGIVIIKPTGIIKLTPTPTPKPTPKPTPTTKATPTPTPRPTSSATSTPAPTATPTPKPTITQAPTATPVPTSPGDPTATDQPTATTPPDPTATQAPDPTSPQPTSSEPTSSEPTSAEPTAVPTTTDPTDPADTPTEGGSGEITDTVTQPAGQGGFLDDLGSGGLALVGILAGLLLLLVGILVGGAGRKRKKTPQGGNPPGGPPPGNPAGPTGPTA